MPEGILFKYDEYLKDLDITEFKNGFEKFLRFIYKQVSTVIGTRKLYNNDFIKKILLETEGEDSFSVKVSLKKPRIGNLSINLFVQSPFGVVCILWKKEYTKKEDLEADIEYLVSNLDKIKTEENQEVV